MFLCFNSSINYRMILTTSSGCTAVTVQTAISRKQNMMHFLNDSISAGLVIKIPIPQIQHTNMTFDVIPSSLLFYWDLQKQPTTQQFPARFSDQMIYNSSRPKCILKLSLKVLSFFLFLKFYNILNKSVSTQSNCLSARGSCIDYLALQNKNKSSWSKTRLLLLHSSS